MIRIYFIISLCFIGFTCNCQTSISKHGNILVDSELNDSSIITITNPRIIRYLPYSFYLDIEDTSNILIEGRNIAFSKDYRNLYQMNVGDSGYYGAQISIYRLTDGVKTRISQTNFKVYDLPITIDIYNKHSGDFISVEKLQKSGLRASIENCDMNFMLPIISFTLALVIDDTLIEIKEESNRISEEQLKYLKRVKEGHPIIFKDIVVEKQNGGFKELKPLVYFLKN